MEEMKMTAPEAKAPESQNQAKAPKAKAQPPQNPVDQAKYEKYVGLKFLSLSETKLTDEANKELNDLEAELKKCSGKISKRTVRAAIVNEQLLLVEGIPMPESYAKIIKKAESEAYYIK